MRRQRATSFLAPLLRAAGLLSFFLLPSVSHAQGVVRDALACFPADTQQVAYVNLAQLRNMAEYPQIRPYLLNRQFRDFQDFLRSLGIDSEKDVDEVLLGWRGAGTDRPGMMGRAEGRFDAEKVRRLLVRQQLPIREHQGHELYAFGSGEDPTDIVFVFLTSSSAAFGRLGDLKDLLDTRAGARPALDTNASFVEWAAELEGTSPQWGISTGKAASLAAGPWLAAGGKQTLDPSAVFGPMQAVLYRMDWGGSVTTHVSIVCQNDEFASALAQVLTILRSARPAAGANPLSPALATLLEGVEVRSSGSRVELSTMAPMAAIDQVLRGGGMP